jgi:class 3 adenylate cyclase
MVSIIKQYQGTIDEFIGDAIFVLFGAPVVTATSAGDATASAKDASGTPPKRALPAESSGTAVVGN